MNKIKIRTEFRLFFRYMAVGLYLSVMFCSHADALPQDRNSLTGDYDPTVLLPTRKTVELDLFESDIIDEGLIDGPSSWYASGSILSQKSNIWGGSPDVNSPEKPGTYAIIEKNHMPDYILTVNLKLPEDGTIGVMFRYNDKNNYYRFSIASQKNYKALIKKTDGRSTILAENLAPLSDEQWQCIKIQIFQNNISIFINDRYFFHAVDKMLPIGKVGLYCWGNENAEFKNVTLSNFTNANQNKIQTPKEKIVATPVSVEKASTKKKALKINSAATPAVSAATIRPPKFEKKISESGKKEKAIPININKFTIVDDGKKNGPSVWRVVDNVLTQSSNIWGSSMDHQDPSKPGTYAIYNIGRTKNYTVYVDLNSGDDDSIGVLFRYQNENNYYRFSMNKEQKKRQLIKKINGKVTLLGETNNAYEPDKWYTVKLIARHDQLTVMLDDKIIFNVHDNSLTYGKFGMYCWGNQNSRFKNIRFSPHKKLSAPMVATQKPPARPEKKEPPPKISATPSSPPVKTAAVLPNTSYKYPVKKTAKMMKKNPDMLPAVVRNKPVAKKVSPGKAMIPRKVMHEVSVIKKSRDIDTQNIRIVDDGNISTPSSWVLYGDVLFQTSSIWGNANQADSGDNPGTYAVFKAKKRLPDYIFTVDLCAQNKNEIGVMFGYRDKNNYYKFTMNADKGYKRLFKKVGGKTTILAEAFEGYDAGRWYKLKAMVVDFHIQIFLDNNLIFNVNDDFPLAGDYALFCFRNDYSAFKNIKFQKP